MQYKAEVKRYDPDDEAEATFQTREEAAEWLHTQRRYFGWGCNMWLNSDKVQFHGPHLVNMEPEGVDRMVSRDWGTELLEGFRPLTTRRSAPQNPATHAEKGEPI